MIKINTAIILAAGFGKRLLPLTKDQPKPMVKLAGKPLIDWQIQRLKAAGISKLLINGHYQHKILFDHLAQYFDISLFYEPELLDTGGAILNMMAKMGASFPEYFIVTNCDSLYFDQDLHQNEYQILCKYFDPNLHKALL
ncbi:MAG: NDP-sugar synthase, partial [Alphaproteobacteria bacterium]